MQDDSPVNGVTRARPQAAVSHSERLWPGPWLWLIASGMIAMLAIAYGAALGSGVGWLVAGTLSVIVGALVVRGTPRLMVEPAGLRAGRATLPWGCIGRVVTLDASGVRLARGPQGDPSAFVVSRPGVGPGAVVVEVVDPSDPHRTWLLATRHPAALASAIERSRGRLRP